jgi:hypothetical protein
MDWSKNIRSLAETKEPTACHICQEVLGCESLLMKEVKPQNIWKRMHRHRSKVGELTL